MVYKCQKCGFIHEGKMPDGYFCPYCHANLFDFKLISEEEQIYKRVLIEQDNPAINRIEEKCINCGACSKICQSVVGLSPDDKKHVCLNCGQCILSCPKGALTPKYDYQTVWELINVPDTKVVVMTSPAVRVAIGDAFDEPAGAFLEGKMVAALKQLGFDYVFDTNFGADLTVVEEVAEFIKRIETGGQLPLFSSCCPSWVKYLHNFHPELVPHLSTCKSPIGMEAAVLKEIFAKEEGINPEKLVVVALTPCTAKKQEILNNECDYVITTGELALLIREQNIDFKKLKDEKFDSVTGTSSIFGATGGVALSVIRAYYHEVTGKHLDDDLLLIKDKDFYQEYSVKVKNKIIKCAVVYSLTNVEKLIPILSDFAFVEVMNCRAGCIGGGGQCLMPAKALPELLAKRAEGLKRTDKGDKIKRAYENPLVKELYEDHLEAPLSARSKELLHIDGAH